MALIVSLIIGGVAGWLAGLIMKGEGFGLIGNIVVGMVGALEAASTSSRSTTTPQTTTSQTTTSDDSDY